LKRPKVVVICGPTGIGKTSVGIHLAKRFQAEIISADSMQIYRQMNIGTAKPTAPEQAAIPHHLIDVLDPDEPCDAARFADMARRRITELHRRAVTPFMVGGTGLYIKATLQGIFTSAQTDIEIRERWFQAADDHGVQYLYEVLQQQDPETAKKLHPHDRYRIIRALEVQEATGLSISEHHRRHAFSNRPFEALKIGLRIDRETLYDRINRRVDHMVADGLVQEVRELLRQGYTPEMKSMQSIGYRHVTAYLTGRTNWNETLRTLKRDTRRFAKRQLTWFNADPEIVWSSPGKLDELEGLIEKFLVS
jgi:tRNA dimethylallyltransferase